MGEQKPPPNAQLKIQEILSKHSIENSALLNDLTEVVTTLLLEDSHPKFTIGDDVPNVEVEPESPDAEDGDDSFDEDESFLLRELKTGKMKHRELEKKVSAIRAVSLRRKFIQAETKVELTDIPYLNYNYELIKGACCENPIGFIPVPFGVAGPIQIDGEDFHIPLATTEGALIASISRGCKVVSENGGVKSFVEDIGMTRAPHFKFPTFEEAIEFYNWIKNSDNFITVKSWFEETSSFAKLQFPIRPVLNGKAVYVRFVATTGDAMGMNMVSKGVERVVQHLEKQFEKAELRSLSSNMCTDKKAAAINVINNRGKSVNCAVTIRAGTVEKQLHTTVDRMVNICKEKCSDGSSFAVTIGGGNAQAANVVAAMFIATGQDAAQVISSSMCTTTMEKDRNGDLFVSCKMPCLEVGTVGGGTILPPQKAVLNMLNCSGSNKQNPGDNAKQLAKIICSTVLAGEVSLMAALCTDDLVKSHMRMNRSAVNMHASTEPDLHKHALQTAAAKRAIPSEATSVSSTFKAFGTNKLANKLANKVKSGNCDFL